MNKLADSKKVELVQKKISDATPYYKVNLEKTDGEELNFLVEHNGTKCFLSSTYDIGREMLCMFQDIDKGTETLVMFGLGQGHAVKYAMKNLPALRKIIVIEPSLEVFSENIKHGVLNDVESTIKNIHVICNESIEKIVEALMVKLQGDLRTNISFVYHLSYISLFKEYYDRINEGLVARVRIFHTGMNTKLQITSMNIVNEIRNLKHEGVRLEELIHMLKGIPSILVSAGPSLNKNMHLLEQAKSKALVYAAGSAIKILDSNKIIPHFNVAMSPRENEINVFKGVNTENAILIYAVQMYHEVLDIYKGKTIKMISNTGNFDKYFYNKCKYPIVNIGGGHTVSNVAFALMCAAKADKIIITGQDLCLGDEGKLYANGSWAQLRYGENSANMIKTKDIYGNDVMTLTSFMGVKVDFESQIKANPGTEFIYCTEGGLGIDGARNANLAEVLEALPERPEIHDIITEINSICSQRKSDKIDENLKRVLIDIRQEISKLLKINDMRAQKIEKLIRQKEFKVPYERLLEEYGKMGKFNKNLSEFDFYRTVIWEDIKDIYYYYKLAFDYQGDDKKMMLEANEKFYGAECHELASYAMLILREIEMILALNE